MHSPWGPHCSLHCRLCHNPPVLALTKAQASLWLSCLLLPLWQLLRTPSNSLHQSKKIFIKINRTWQSNCNRRSTSTLQTAILSTNFFIKKYCSPIISSNVIKVCLIFFLIGVCLINNRIIVYSLNNIWPKYNYN